jgi:site-specific recombinase XerD
MPSPPKPFDRNRYSDRAEVRTQLVGHLTGRCGMDEKAANKLLPKAQGKGTSRPALTAEGLRLWEVSVKREIENPVIKAILLLLPRTGMRIAEICNLTQENWHQEGGQEGWRFVGKGEKERFVPLGKGEWRIWDAYAVEMSQRNKDVDRITWLFPNPGVTYRISMDRVRRAVNRMTAVEAGLAGVTPHVLRHTWASMAVAQCRDLDSVAKHLGHDSLGTTMTYLHPGAFDLY